MDGDLDLAAAAGLASLASDKGKSGASQKAAAPKPKKQQVTNARVATATREALCMLGLNPSQHGLVVATAVSTGSSTFPRALLPDSPRVSACNPVPGFDVYPQVSRLSGECSPEVSVAAPSTPAPTTIDLTATPVAGGSSCGGARKRTRQTPADQLPGARNLFDGMPAAADDYYMQNMIFEAGAQAVGFDPDETQSQDGRGYNEDQAAFMRDQVGVGLDLDGFPLDHEFPHD
ncbi:DNA repair protein rhp54 [Hordeum vulgare]|nr:DNA repair protein rhp54 [Hordeum vulgare]